MLLFSPCYSNLLLRRRGWTGILRWGVLGYVLRRLSFLWCYGVFRYSVPLRVIIVFRNIIYVIIIILYSWYLIICEPFWPMCGTIDPGSCIRWVHGFGIKTGYDTSLGEDLRWSATFVVTLLTFDWMGALPFIGSVCSCKTNEDTSCCVIVEGPMCEVELHGGFPRDRRSASQHYPWNLKRQGLFHSLWPIKLAKSRGFPSSYSLIHSLLHIWIMAMVDCIALVTNDHRLGFVAVSCNEDINTLATIIPSIEILGPITQSRAQQLNHQVNSFLCSSTYNIESRLLPNDLIVLRNQGGDHGGQTEHQEGAGEPRRRAREGGEPIQFGITEFESNSESRTTSYSNWRPNCIWPLFWMFYICTKI
jgi:hypothetical protein